MTGGLLLWLHCRRPTAYPFIRTTLLLASALAVVGYVVFPIAPTRLSNTGILDTVSNKHVDLNAALVSSLYNPNAAVPRMHVGYELIVGASIARYAPHLITRLAGLAYPPFVLLVIVAAGNQVFVDAAAGAAVAGVALLAARRLARRRPTPCPHQLAPAVRSATSTQNTTAPAAAQGAA